VGGRNKVREKESLEWKKYGRVCSECGLKI